MRIPLSYRGCLTMRLSDAGLRQRQTKADFIPIIDSLLGSPKTRPRDRSNRLLGGDFLIREMGRIGARGRVLDGD